MCLLDRKTGKVVKDCGDCGCGQSKNCGKHNFRKTGVMRIGKAMIDVYRCARCQTYRDH